jgi:integrase/recombinase XerC
MKLALSAILLDMACSAATLESMENDLSVHTLITKYLNWCGKHRSPRTLEWYTGHLDNFLAHLGEAKDGPATNLKPYNVIEWIDAQTGWGDNYSRGAIVAVQRAYNWAEELGYIESTPLKKIKKPPAKRRETFMTPEDFEQILGHLKASDPFRDLFLFVWHTGCRPQEARHIEPRHVQLEHERIVFPAEESKGKRSKRIIYLQGVSLEIIQRLIAEDRAGKLFLNNRGTPWTKFAICNRFHRLSQKTGKRMFCYAARHGFGTRKLIQGHDHLTVAAIMGHTDGSMLAKVYSHVDKDVAHMKRALVD